MPTSRRTPRPDFEDDSARGRFAEKITQITTKGWKDIGLRLKEEVTKDRISLVAGGSAFFLILALFPALAALVSLYGLIADPATLEQQIATLSGVLPGGALDILREELHRLVTQNNSSLGFAFVFTLLISLWSANNGIKTLFMAMNVAYDEEEKRSFIKLNLVSLGFTLLAMIGAVALVSATIVVPALIGLLGLGGTASWLITILRWPLLLVLVGLGIAALYRWGPSRAPPRWRWISWGTLITALLWLIVSGLFSWYVANFGSYNATYGSLGAIIGFMMWTYISIFILLIGAELNSEIEHQVLADTTTGTPRAMGDRGAVKADTIGKPRAK